MELVLTRDVFTKKSTTSKMTEHGKFRCFFLEDRFRRPGEAKVPGETCIPCGRYRITFEKSPHLSALAGHEVKTPRLHGVPNFEGVLIHPGNKPPDTKGCPLPGLERGVDEVMHSVKAYEPLAADIEAAIDRGEEVYVLVQLAAEGDRTDPEGLTKGLTPSGNLHPDAGKAVAAVTLALAAIGALLVPATAFAQEAGPGPTVDGSIGAKVLNTFLQYALPPIVTAIAGIVVLALTKLSAFLHAKAEGSKVGTALVGAADFVMTAVQHVVSGLAPDVRSALANDGKIDDAERTVLKQKALTLIKAELPADIVSVLGSLYGAGLDTWLSGKAEQAIDAAVMGAKGAALPAPAPTPVP